MASAKEVHARVRCFWQEEQAVSATEYAILLALIVLVCAAAIQGIGSRMINLYTAIDASMPAGF